MSITEELGADTRQNGGCTVCQFLASRPPAERQEWVSALARPVNLIGDRAVVRGIARHGGNVTRHAVRRHRGGRHAVD